MFDVIINCAETRKYIMKKISIVTPCYNEEENVKAIADVVKKMMAEFPQYDYEHIFIDNASTDKTQKILRDIAAADKRVKVIINVRNFGHIRSPYYGLLQGTGDAVMNFAADFQDPPDMIGKFIRKWEEGYKVVLGVKNSSGENRIMFFIRKLYYDIISKLSDIEITKNNTGFGLYDQCVIKELRKLNEPYPFLRGLVADLGYESAKIEYYQPARRFGITKINFYMMYDIGILGIINHSKIPLRLAVFSGFIFALLNLFAGIGYFIYKLINWNSFTVGVAPVVIGLFFFASVQLIFLGVLGEYIGAIYTQTLRRPLVIEKERINF